MLTFFLELSNKTKYLDLNFREIKARLISHTASFWNIIIQFTSRDDLTEK